MNSLRFDQPVTILVGLGFPCRMKTVNAALTFLRDRAVCEHDEAWEAAMAVCRDAMDGRVCAAEARDVFAAYARRRNILVEEPLQGFDEPAPERTGNPAT